MNIKLESCVSVHILIVPVSRLNEDTNTIKQGLSYELVQVIQKLFFIPAMLAILFYLSTYLATVMSLCILPVIVYFVVALSKSKKLQEDIQDTKAECSVLAEETFSNVRTVKAFCTENLETSKFRALNAAVFKTQFYQSDMWAGFGFTFQVCIYSS